MQPLVEIALYAPDLIEAPVRTAVLSGLEFLRPYFLRQAAHTEFDPRTKLLAAIYGEPQRRAQWP